MDGYAKVYRKERDEARDQVRRLEEKIKKAIYQQHYQQHKTPATVSNIYYLRIHQITLKEENFADFGPIKFPRKLKKSPIRKIKLQRNFSKFQ